MAPIRQLLDNMKNRSSGSELVFKKNNYDFGVAVAKVRRTFMKFQKI